MSQENVDVVREGYAAWNRGHDELKAFVGERYTADATIYPLTDWFSAEILRGRDEIVRGFMELREGWEGVEIEVEEIVDSGDHVVSAIHVSGVIAGTKDELDMRLGLIHRLRDGKIAEVRYFHNLAEALEVAGLSE